MGDDDRGSTLHERVQTVDHLGLAQRVEPRCGFVQDEDRRVSQENSCDSDPLALTSGEPDAARSEFRVVARRQLGDEAICV